MPSPVTPCFGQPRPRPQPSGAPEAVRGVVRPGSPILSRGRHQFGRVRAAHPRVSRPAGGVDRPGRWPGGACPRPQAAAEASREGIPAGTPILSRGRRRDVPSPVTPCFGQPRPRPQPSGAPEAVRGVVRPGSPILSRGRHQFGRVRAAHPRVSRPAGGVDRPGRWPGGACPRPQAAAEASREGIPAGTPILSRGRRRTVPSAVSRRIGRPGGRPHLGSCPWRCAWAVPGRAWGVPGILPQGAPPMAKGL